MLVQNVDNMDITENNLLKDKIQKEALNKWLDNNKIGTCEIITGLGKTFIGLHALYTMPKDNTVHLFLAEATDRKKDLIEDIKKYNKIFSRDVLNDYNLQFYCYQSAYRWKGKLFGLIIADEIHDSLSPAYSKFYENNKYTALIGLTATVSKNTKYIVEGKEITKGDFLKKIAPICYKYTVGQGQKDKTARKLNIYVIQHELDNINKNIIAGNSKNRFYQTEYNAYTYWDKEYKKAFYINDPELKTLKIRITSSKRKNILYNLHSKIQNINTLLHNLNSKTIIFGNSLDALYKITPNVISSRNSELQNNRIRYAFDNDKIKVIGSFKKLKQGANLVNLDNCIIMSYYGIDKDFIQRIGRLRDNGQIGNVFIFVTKNTQEEIWFTKMTENLDNLRIINCENLNECLTYIKNKK